MGHLCSITEIWDPTKRGRDPKSGPQEASDTPNLMLAYSLCTTPPASSVLPTVLISLLCLGSSAQNRVEVLAGDLRFSKLSLEDSGMYQCVAENKHGTIYASAELAVQGKGIVLEPAGCAGWA